MESLQRHSRKVRAYQRLLKVANWLAALPNRVTPPPFRLLQIESAFWQSRALYVATRLGVADVVGDGEKACDAIAAQLELHADHLYRLLRMLASLGIFTETAPRRFANSKLSHHLRRDHPQSVRAMILMHHSPPMLRPWLETLEEGIRSGATPFVKSHGVELFDYMDSDAAFDQLFAEAMDAVEALTGNDYLQDFDWSRFDRLIDVGGSKGAKSLAILARAPRLQALVFDRPQVIEHAAASWQGKVEPGVLQRVEFVGGDMREAIPVARSARDLYLFMAVFHGMGDADAQRVLRNLHIACGEHTPTIAVVEMVAEEQNIDATVASFDLQMLVNTHGRERTRDEWQRLFAAGGFAIEEIVTVRTFARFIVVRPV